MACIPTIIQGINDKDSLLQRWKDATLAYQDLILGQQLTEGRHSIEMMRFSQASPAALAAYISDLATQLSTMYGVCLPGRRIRARNVYYS